MTGVDFTLKCCATRSELETKEHHVFDELGCGSKLLTLLSDTVPPLNISVVGSTSLLSPQRLELVVQTFKCIFLGDVGSCSW